MYILYVDESGNTNNPNDEYFVLGAVAIYETRVFFLSRDLDAIQDKWFPGATSPIEFHSAQIYNRNCEPWRSLSRDQAMEILYDLCDKIVSTSDKGLHLFGVAVHKKSFPRDDIVERHFMNYVGILMNLFSRKTLS